jgi:copper(I)-binding protein
MHAHRQWHFVANPSIRLTYAYFIVFRRIIAVLMRLPCAPKCMQKLCALFPAHSLGFIPMSAMKHLALAAALTIAVPALSVFSFSHAHAGSQTMPQMQTHPKDQNFGHAAAHGHHVSGAFARATPGHLKNGAAFLILENTTDKDDALVAAQAPVATSVELHTHTHDNGVMRMRQVPEIPVAAHAETVLRPGGYHVMLIGLKAPLQEGENFPLTLKFKSGASIVVNVPVKAVGAMGTHKGNMQHQGHKNMPAKNQ